MFGGINHLALVTNDMEKTVRFYRDVLGMPLVAAIGNAPGGYPYRHYFFETGPNNTIAFFEWPGLVEEFHKPAGQPAGGRTRGRVSVLPVGTTYLPVVTPGDRA